MGLGDKLSNATDKVVGDAKDKVGGATGDRNLQAEGKAQNAEGHVKQAGENVKDALKDAKDGLK